MRLAQTKKLKPNRDFRGMLNKVGRTTRDKLTNKLIAMRRIVLSLLTSFTLICLELILC